MRGNKIQGCRGHTEEVYELKLRSLSLIKLFKNTFIFRKHCFVELFILAQKIPSIVIATLILFKTRIIHIYQKLFLCLPKSSPVSCSSCQFLCCKSIFGEKPQSKQSKAKKNSEPVEGVLRSTWPRNFREKSVTSPLSSLISQKTNVTRPQN